jgi:UDP-2,3-diacylglucosamine hydrolase
MICGWKIISRRIEHSSFHDNQIYFWREDIPYYGDGKGPGDLGYKRMKKVFTNPFSNGFSDGTSDLGVKLAQYLSVKKQTHFW